MGMGRKRNGCVAAATTTPPTANKKTYTDDICTDDGEQLRRAFLKMREEKNTWNN